MAKKLHLAILCVFIGLFGHAQVISIVGTGVNGWPPNQIGAEITLSSTDNVTYTISNLAVNTGEIKFRQDMAWTTNWGNNSANPFPSGVATLNGGNIPTQAGTYTVTFNRTTGAYNFSGAASFPMIQIWGPAVDSQQGFAGPGVDMVTSDGINYTLSGFIFSSGVAKFRQPGTTLSYGSVEFPTGTAVQDGPNFFVPGGEYSVTFNRTTGAYNFAFPSIGIIGSAVNGWDVADTDLSTTNGETYTLTNLPLLVGELKFRQDNAWNVSFGGGTFPMGTSTQGGDNIIIPTAENYDVTFNKITGDFNFSPSLATKSFANNLFVVYPNPSNDNWNISAKTLIDNISVVDISGKQILMANPSSENYSINADILAKGLYFATVTSGKSVQTIKLVRK